MGIVKLKSSLFKIVLSTLILNLNSILLVAQDSPLNKYSIEIDYGISRTLHYNQPVNFYLCFEGCIAEEQKSRSASNFGVSLYRAFDKNNSLKIGGGSSAYRFLENGLLSPGGFGLSPYERNRKFAYYNFSTGFRHIFDTKNQVIRPFLELDIIYEKLKDKEYRVENLKKFGLAVKSLVGTNIEMADNLYIVVAAFYKSGITDYSNLNIDDIPSYNTTYIPFAYGIQAGMHLILDKP